MLKSNMRFADVVFACFAIIGGLLLFVFPTVTVVLSLLCALVLAWPRRAKTESRLQLP